MKLNVKAMAITMAIIGGLGLFCLTWWIILFEGASVEPNLISKIYRGYTFSPLGSIIGMIWGFADGAIGGVCIAWIYNAFVSRNNDGGQI
ncbi:bacteriophage holin [Bacteroidota bacterium]